MSDVTSALSAVPPRRWCPLGAADRRVAGVLVEKAKTTPEAYPMSLNALRTGCNQKNNRDPVVEMSLEQVEESLDRLKTLGVVAEVQGGSRVSRYRHLLYEWLGVDKVELAIMAELLLRGAQTEGELRGRAARMEPIADLMALRPVLSALKAKELIVSLSPEGRGHVLTHALYEPRELERMRKDAVAPEHDAPTSRPAMAPSSGHVPVSTQAESDETPRLRQAVSELRQELDEIRGEMARLREDFDALRSNLL
jgi:uncharacterized protein YceH (UPF0502 family)